jgi:hypothetical protein
MGNLLCHKVSHLCGAGIRRKKTVLVNQHICRFIFSLESWSLGQGRFVCTKLGLRQWSQVVRSNL